MLRRLRRPRKNTLEELPLTPSVRKHVFSLSGSDYWTASVMS